MRRLGMLVGLLIALLVVLLIGGWVWLEHAATPRALVDVAAPPRPAAEARDEAAPIVLDRTHEEHPPDGPAATSTVTDPATLYPVRVQVVDAERERPVADLALEVSDRGSVPELSRARTDATGMAEVLWSGGPATLTLAWRGHRLHYSLQDSRDGELLLRLKDSREVGVEARFEGRPIPGVEVWIQDGFELFEPPSSGTARTDENGQATLRVPPRAALGEEVGDLYAVADVIADPSVAALVSGSGIEAGSVLLEMPWTGRLEVTVLEPGGEPYVGAGHVSVAIASMGTRYARREANVERRVPLVNGQALSPPVQLGLTLEVAAFLPGAANVGPLRVDGPVAAGQVVPVVLEVERKVTLIATVRSAGKPVADEELHVELHVELLGEGSTSAGGAAAGPPSLHLVRRTADDGALRWPLSPELRASGFRPRELCVYRPATGEFGAVRVPALGTAAENRLPDVALEMLPVLVSGRVLDGEGRPLERSQVRVLLSLDRPFDGQAAVREALRTDTAADGSFLLRGPLDRIRPALSSGTQVLAQLEGHVSRRVDVELPATDVEVVLATTGGVEMQIAVPDPAFLAFLDAELQEIEGTMPTHHRATLVGTAFQWDGLPPGDYRLVIHFMADRTVHRMQPITVQGGQVTRIPEVRLGPMRSVQVIVRDETGRLLEEARFDVLIGEDQTRWSGPIHEFPLGTDEFAELTVSAPGYRSQTVIVREDQDLVMVPGVWVTLKLRGLPRDLVNRRCYLGSTPEDPHTLAGANLFEIDEHDEVFLRLPEAGRYRVSLPLPTSVARQLQSPQDQGDYERRWEIQDRYSLVVEARETDHLGVIVMDYPAP